MITKDIDGKSIEELYDPHVDLVLEEIAKLTGQFGGADHHRKATPTAR